MVVKKITFSLSLIGILHKHKTVSYLLYYFYYLSVFAIISLFLLNQITIISLFLNYYVERTSYCKYNQPANYSNVSNFFCLFQRHIFLFETYLIMTRITTARFKSSIMGTLGVNVTAAYDQGSTENPVGVSQRQSILQQYCYDLNKS